MAVDTRDGQGTVRIKGVSPRTEDGYDKGIVKYLYRDKGARDWVTLSTYAYMRRRRPLSSSRTYFKAVVAIAPATDLGTVLQGKQF